MRWRSLTEAGELEPGAATPRAGILSTTHRYYDYPDPSPRSLAENTVQFSRELDNVRAALDWAFAPKGDHGDLERQY